MSSSLDFINSNTIEDSANGDASQEEEELELTAFEVILRLEKAWMNELFAPELLEPQIEVIDCLLDQIKKTEENLSQLDIGHFSIPLHKMELARVRFLIASYLRLRLQKIQKHAHSVLKSNEDDLNARYVLTHSTMLPCL
jgi:GINS complex subunit 4